jgi:predicted ATPase
LETVAAVASEYETVATADLDQVSSVPLVPPAIAAALRVQEATGPLLLDSVVGYVGSRRILLVLDSFEQVIGAASVVARLVAGTTRLTVLVTSREPLHLTGERVFEVPPLDVPTWSDGIDAARRSDSVQLFVDRAVAGGAHLRLDSAEVHTIAEICHRLDGLPLAIELAASRARMLDLDDLLRRLDASLVTLTGGARDLPTRQRTLNSAIAWSYDLLDDPDRRLLGRLGVFEGSFALDAAEAICGADGVPSVFDGISSLVDKALLRPDHARPGQPRFAMLQVVREYAIQRLSATGEADRLRERHAEFYRRLTAEAGARLKHGGMRSVVEQYIADQGNGRAAVQWFLDTGDGDSAARMGLSIWPMLFTQGLLTEGHEAMERALETGLTLTEDNRANARLVLGLMAFGRGDYDRAGAVLQPAYERYVQRGDESGAATASVPLGVIAAVRTPGEGEGLLHGAVDGFRRLDDRWGLTFALLALGTTLATGNREGDAIAPLEEGAQVARQIQDDVLLSNALIGLGWARLRLGEVAAAGEQLDEALDLSVTFGSRETIARALDAVAALAEKTGDASRGATLFGAAEGVRGALRADVWEIDRASHAETAQRLRARLGDEPYQRLSGRGASLALDEVLHLASAR